MYRKMIGICLLICSLLLATVWNEDVVSLELAKADSARGGTCWVTHPGLCESPPGPPCEDTPCAFGNPFCPALNGKYRTADTYTTAAEAFHENGNISKQDLPTIYCTLKYQCKQFCEGGTGATRCLKNPDVLLAQEDAHASSRADPNSFPCFYITQFKDTPKSVSEQLLARNGANDRFFESE